MDLLTPDEVAALLTERGMTGRDGGPVRADTVRYWLQRGLFPHAKHLPGRRGLWLVPLDDVEAFFHAPTPA